LLDLDVQQGVSAKLSSFTKEACSTLHEFGLLRPLVRRAALSVLTDQIPLTEEEVLEAQIQFCRENQIASEQELDRKLASLGVDRNLWLEQLTVPLKATKYAIRTFSLKSEAHFLSRKNSLDAVVYSLIRVSSENMAYNLYLQLEENPDSFEHVARSFGEGFEKKNGGRIGPVSLSLGDPALTSRLRGSRVGELIQPFKVQEWWLLARLEELQSARFDDEMRHRMCQELFDEWLNKQVDCIIKES